MWLATLLACTGPADVPSEPSALDRELAALAVAERRVLVETATAGLAEGRLADAIPAVREGLAIYPEPFASLADQLADALEEAGDADGLASLAAVSSDPRFTARARAARHGAVARASISPSGLESAIASGATPEGADWIIDTVDRLYVTAPDWAALTGVAGRRLEAVAAAHGHPAPALSPAAERQDAKDHLRRGIAAFPGTPAQVVIVAWTDALLEGLDPWSRVVWPAEISAWEAHHAGVLLDVGATLSAADGAVIVEDLAPGSPAWTANLHVGDHVTHVGQVALQGSDAPLETARTTLAGPPGTRVLVGVSRDGAPIEVAIDRTPYRPELVTGARRTEDGTWETHLRDGVHLVRIAAFRPWVDEAFDAMLGDATPAAVILDLRGNPGGDVSAAVNVADRFVPDGLLAGMDGRALPDTDPGTDPETGQALAAWNQAIAGHALEGVALAVLIDGQTASAAELCAGALQQRVGATLVGMPTVGKGRSQRLESGPGLALQVTNLRWTLPDGRVLDGHGLVPDIHVPLGPAARFQVTADRRAVERPTRHADGSRLPAKAPSLRADLPRLSADPSIARALIGLSDLEVRTGTAPAGRKP